MLRVRGRAPVVSTGGGAFQRRGRAAAAGAGTGHDTGSQGGRESQLMDARLLEILACPVCKGTLKYQRDAQLLVCRMDRLAYPIRDAVPVMLEEEARQLAADDPLLER